MRRLSSGNKLASTLILNFPVSRIVKNCCLISSVHAILLWKLKITYSTSWSTLTINYHFLKLVVSLFKNQICQLSIFPNLETGTFKSFTVLCLNTAFVTGLDVFLDAYSVIFASLAAVIVYSYEHLWLQFSGSFSIISGRDTSVIVVWNLPVRFFSFEFVPASSFCAFFGTRQLVYLLMNSSKRNAHLHFELRNWKIFPSSSWHSTLNI